MMKMVIIAVVFLILGLILGVILCTKVIIAPSTKQMLQMRELSSKHFELYMLMKNWLKVRQEGKNLQLYFVNNSYKRIAVYGMNYVGEALLRELIDTEVEILAGIDRNANNISANIMVVTPEEFKEEVDVIVVTPITYFDEIVEMLEKKVKCPIVSIEDVIYEVASNR